MKHPKGLRRERFGRSALTLLMLACAGLAACGSDDSSDDTQVLPGVPAKLFLGRVVTMDDAGTIAEAVAVDQRGVIVAVGSEQHVRKAVADNPVETIRLQSEEVLMPGFIEPHMHLLATILQNVPTLGNLAPCLPGPYAAANHPGCSNYIKESLRRLPKKGRPSKNFVVGMNLDPSRQAYDESRGGDVFTASPAAFIAQEVTGDEPVFIADQSGHLGYVNQKAIDLVHEYYDSKDKAWPPVLGPGGEWVTDSLGNYTGLLREGPAFVPFQEAMAKDIPYALVAENPVALVKDVLTTVKSTIADLRAAGLTTITDGGQTSKLEMEAAKLIAELPTTPLRVTGVVVYSEAPEAPSQPKCDPITDPSCALPKWLGVRGIKLWADGSTQGCTAWLADPRHYVPEGHCEDAGYGHPDYNDPEAIAAALEPLWNTGKWMFEVHANGNNAIAWVTEAFALLQQRQPNPHRALIIHGTVGVPGVVDGLAALRTGRYTTSSGAMVPAVDVRVTHLIGHVAYWGDVFREILGPEAAALLDPTALDMRNDIPFSLHSDSMVTPARPLWYVEQAVTRRTWKYPELTEAGTLGADQAPTIEQALRAITIEPARQQEMDQWLGSIEVGKVADFTVLGANPLDYAADRGGDPTQLHSIPVVATYINGEATR